LIRQENNIHLARSPILLKDYLRITKKLQVSQLLSFLLREWEVLAVFLAKGLKNKKISKDFYILEKITKSM